MDIAIRKRKENIAEYILYLWQIEDLLRALQFSPQAIYSQFVKPRNLTPDAEQTFLLWYMDIANLLTQEGKEKSGHLDHTLHLIADLHNLHLQLMQLPIGAQYRNTVARLAPFMPTLRATMDNTQISDTELCFRALYGAMLYKIKGEGSKAIADVVEYISPVIAQLSDMYGKVERGEVDLFKNN